MKHIFETKNSFKIKDGEIRSSSITILCKVGKLMKDPIKKVDLSYLDCIYGCPQRESI